MALLSCLASLSFGVCAFLLVAAVGRTRRIWGFGQALAPGLSITPPYPMPRLSFILRSSDSSGQESLNWDEMLLSFAHEVKAGNSLQNAVLALISTVKGEPKKFLERALAEYQSGVNLQTSFKNAARCNYGKDLAAIVEIGIRTGADMPVLILNLADSLKKETAFFQEAKTKLLEAKLTATLLSFLPWFIVGASQILGVDSLGALLSNPKGMNLLLIALLTWFSGTAIIAVLIKSAVPRKI